MAIDWRRIGTAVVTGGLSEVPNALDELSGSKDVVEATRAAAEAASRTADENRQLNVERYDEAKGYMSPYLEGSENAYGQLLTEMGLAPGEAGTAYMDSPGYSAAMSGVEQTMANTGSLYSGRRKTASEQVGGQFYNNYMNILQRIGNPDVATNLSSLGVGQGATMGNQAMQDQQIESGYMLGGAQATQAGRADMLGGIANISGGAMAGGYI